MNNTHTTLTRMACIVSLLIAATLSHAQVAMRQIQSGNMPITLIYPTAAPSQPLTQGAFTLQVANNALPDYALAATLARAGFVVAQPEHRGDNWQDFSRAGPESWKTRPQDVSDTINAVAQDPVLASLVDTRRVGVHGMSAGGVTHIGMILDAPAVAAVVQACRD